jgi:hypothetical protein
LPRDRESRKTVELGERIIGDDEIETALMERLRESRLCFHTDQIACNAVVRKVGSNQLGIVGIVFQQKDSQRIFHWRLGWLSGWNMPLLAIVVLLLNRQVQRRPLLPEIVYGSARSGF